MDTHEEVVFEVTDQLGRPVRYRKVIYDRHLPDHPEMADYVAEAAETVSDPDYEYQEEEDNEEGASRVYYKAGLGRDEFEMCFIQVPVYYDSDGWGEVATFHFTRRLARGKLVWRRGQSSKT